MLEHSYAMQQIVDTKIYRENEVGSIEKIRRRIEVKIIPWIATATPLIWFILISIWLYTALCNLTGKGTCH